MIYIVQRMSPYKAHKVRRFCLATKCPREITMRKTILTALGAALISASTLQIAAAADRHHHVHKVDRAAASQQFRNANDSVVSPSAAHEYEGHGLSAPAGRS